MKTINKYKSFFFALSLLTSQSQAADVVVQALLEGRAMLQIDGKTRILKVGETSPEGIKLISADSMEAVLEVNGKQAAYTLGQRLSNVAPPDVSKSVLIAQDARGMYLSSGSINGRSVQFLVDTGATSVALSSKEADRLGLTYDKTDVMLARTASGTVPAYRATLETVQIGEIILRDIPATVTEGEHPEEILLGMSFLEQLEIKHRDQFLELRTKE